MHLVLKLSKLCNLRCTYCYEYEELGLKDRMPLEGLESLFESAADWVMRSPVDIPVHITLHGGEPLLLPADYLRAVAALRDKYIVANGIEHTIGVQSNLFSLPDAKIDLLRELHINLGVSVDVFGRQRVDLGGRDSQEKVLGNVQRALDAGIPLGGISVVHAGNVDRIEDIYRFFDALDMDCRLLPIFYTNEPEPRTKHLMIDADRVVEGFKRVIRLMLSKPSRIKVFPLQEYFDAAIRYLTNDDCGEFDPDVHEHVLLVNTNGDTYNNGDPYLPSGYMGNAFRTSVSEIFAGAEHAAVTRLRMARAQTCRTCAFHRRCDQLPVVEANRSERGIDASGRPRCPVARPIIEFIVSELARSQDSIRLLDVLNGTTTRAMATAVGV